MYPGQSISIRRQKKQIKMVEIATMIITGDYLFLDGSLVLLDAHHFGATLSPVPRIHRMKGERRKAKGPRETPQASTGNYPISR